VLNIDSLLFRDDSRSETWRNFREDIEEDWVKVSFIHNKYVVMLVES
jgi:hypothetical protein